MYKFLTQNLLRAIIIGLLVLFSIGHSPYFSNIGKNSSKEHKANESSTATFISNQQVILKTSNIDTRVTVFRSVSVGVSEEGLHLSQLILNMIFLPSLISWDELKYQTPTDNGNRNKPYTFYLGNSKITSLRLYPSTIKKLEAEYGEPIFSNKLGQLN